jgi:hypothetical protein
MEAVAAMSARERESRWERLESLGKKAPARKRLMN